MGKGCSKIRERLKNDPPLKIRALSKRALLKLPNI